MFFVFHQVFQGPGNPGLEGAASLGAVCFAADAAGSGAAGVNVDKNFYGLIEVVVDEGFELFDFGVAFLEVKIPG